MLIKTGRICLKQLGTCVGRRWAKWIGPGHNSIIIQDDEGTDWMIYHSYLKKDGGVGGRLGMLDRVLWTDDGGLISGIVSLLIQN